MSITPKNWSDFQHYKDRAPAWIKLHRKILDDYDFACLPLASRALAPMLWLIASEYEGGKITATMPALAFRLRVTEEDLREGLKPLIDGGFFVDDSEPLADCKQEASLEKRERRGREDIGADAPYAFEGQIVKLRKKTFDDWTKAYPNLDLIGELTARDAWLASASEDDRARWFISTSQHLANRNMTAKAKVVAMKPDGRPQTTAEKLYREGIV